jgi:hypothetical protein
MSDRTFTRVLNEEGGMSWQQHGTLGDLLEEIHSDPNYLDGDLAEIATWIEGGAQLGDIFEYSKGLVIVTSVKQSTHHLEA